MKLITDRKAKIYDYIVQGEMEKFTEDRALASVLRQVEASGTAVFDNLGVFAKGIKSRFEQEQLTGDGKLTPKGQEIARSGYAWKGVKGRFKIRVLVCEGMQYLIGADEYSQADTSGYAEKEERLVLGGEYTLKNKCAFKNCAFDGYVCKRAFAQDAELKVIYDYATEKSQYICTDTRGDKTEFSENKEFCLISREEALSALEDAVENYGLTASGGKVKVSEVQNDNPLFANAVNEVFEKGTFNAVSGDATYSVKDIRLNVGNAKTAKELLLKYLIMHARKRYCGYAEIASLISGFYGLFENCPDIKGKTQNIYAELMESAHYSDTIAYLRLRAYKHLMPEKIQEKCYYKSTKDFSGEKMSMSELVEKIVGKGDVKSVTVLTKYAYKNAAIARAVGLFANVLKRRYNAPLRLITAKDDTQTETAKEFYDKLKINPNIIFVEKAPKEIKKIHDRYYRIENTDGTVEWLKMSGELDALRYDGDFLDGNTPNRAIDENTPAYVKEMTVVGVEEKGIGSDVIRAMEG